MGEPLDDLELAFFVGEGTTTRRLPSAGRLTIGRGDGVAIVLEDASVSRRHAVLHVGASLAIEDLGSANGTSVRRAHRSPSGATTPIERLGREKTPVGVGDTLLFGTVVAVVRRAARPPVASDVVVRDPTMRALYEQVDRVANALLSVLILGETGVGKEVLARSLHERSSRAGMPFVPISCAAIPESLLEAELFGHERGVFTGATQARAGLFETADRGTLFLDEVGELPLATQVKLLRVLEEKSIVRLGGRAPRPVDVRFISATNRDLEALSDEGAFRKDLYYRLNGITLVVPPLRERASEIPDLAHAFAVRAAKTIDRAAVPRFSSDVLDLLRRHTWPGNVRELRNVVERAVVLCPGDTVLPEHLPPGLANARRAASGAPLPSEVDAFERDRILQALERCDGNQTRAAELLGISRRKLVNRLSSWGLTRARRKDV